MKKGLLVFTVALLFAAFVPRPVAAAIDFDWGVKGGLSMASEKWSDDTSASKSLTKPVFGVFFAFNLNKSFAIQPEIYYLTQGGIYTYEPEGIIYKYVDTFNYLQIPVLAKLRLMPDKKLTPIVFAGPAVGVLLSAHYKYSVDGVEEWDKNVKTWYKSTSFGLVFGGGVEYKLDKLMLVLDVRYDLGLANIDKSDVPNPDTLKTRTLMFMVGVGF
jgi:hypothetical protein